MKRYFIWLNGKIVADFSYLKNAVKKFEQLNKKWNADDNMLSLEDYETGETLMANYD